MHPTARRCVWGAVVLWVAGAALVGFAPTLYDLADGWVGEAVDIVVGFLQEALVPTGAVLIGAAIVVQALRGSRSATSGQEAPGIAATAEPGSPTSPPATSPTPLAAPPLSDAIPSVPPSAPVPAVPVPDPVPTSDPGGVPAGPVLPGTGATPVASANPARSGRRPRSRRSRG